ncbi:MULTISPECIES: hypothetical protein [unclassified Pseudomonas]|uniref:hypothetical protein n=1 Tax=unclassified Pseudomonas TaxID=196821 RepID=UPI000C86B8B2|nr:MULTISPECIES: hypothetical protein [unclassified Pseudomonas]PMV17984.1 hypothetical protein C1X17_28050 [Pseudomonas sp. FW305-3-2-15-C-TSA2]PMV18610.1 hypothetical protein C1X22_29455 [Pseudomonas sp. DP16D-L5]PMV33417.1 hypothetical protein C1X21_28975 [Pseudomonas sp. FW305-3-2-15-A-LB2]PMV37992.1 hypothetical protein C1X16_29650 [Pseudomonas sp. FW305-3-2-15-C-R2A1]PMV43567.1 hypothetical protein C1X18_28270 [Pseudomonas sp. FW305-3-2-15-C-LB1]
MKKQSLLTATALLTFFSSYAFANLLTAETSFNIAQQPMCVPQGNIKFDFGTIDGKVANASPDQIRPAKAHAELVLANCPAKTVVNLSSPGTFTTPSISDETIAPFYNPAEIDSYEISLTKASFGVQLLANANVASAVDSNDKSKHILASAGADISLAQDDHVSLFATLHHTMEFQKIKDNLTNFVAGNYKLSVPVTITLK